MIFLFLLFSYYLVKTKGGYAGVNFIFFLSFIQKKKKEQKNYRLESNTSTRFKLECFKTFFVLFFNKITNFSSFVLLPLQFKQNCWCSSSKKIILLSDWKNILIKNMLLLMGEKRIFLFLKIKK